MVRATSDPLLSLWAALLPRCRESKACGFRLASVLSHLGLSNGPGGGADIDFDVCATLAMCAVVKNYVGHHTSADEGRRLCHANGYS
jgi:hypothetical protein